MYMITADTMIIHYNSYNYTIIIHAYDYYPYYDKVPIYYIYHHCPHSYKAPIYAT